MGRRKEIVFFVRYRRTYVLNNWENGNTFSPNLVQIDPFVPGLQGFGTNSFIFSKFYLFSDERNKLEYLNNLFAYFHLDFYNKRMNILCMSLLDLK